MQRVIVNFAPESTIDADLFLRYDYEAKDSQDLRLIIRFK